MGQRGDQLYPALMVVSSGSITSDYEKWGK